MRGWSYGTRLALSGAAILALAGNLAAQAAQLNGDELAARKYFTAMLDRPETRFLGLRGLLTQALKTGDARADRGDEDRDGQLLAQQGRARVDAGDIDEHPLAQRERVEPEPVAAQGGLGIRAAAQHVPHRAREIAACRHYHLLQAHEACRRW